MTNAKASYKHASASTKRIIRGEVKRLRLELPDASAREIREALKKRKRVHLMPIPPERTIQDMIRKFENPQTAGEKQARERFNRLQKPWGLDTIEDDPIAPEAMPSVIRVWAYSLEQRNHEFTVRDAKWVSRLHVIKPGNIEWLTDRVLMYSDLELMCELTGPQSKWGGKEEILALYRDMTGEDISSERYETIVNGRHTWIGIESSARFVERIKSKLTREAEDERVNSQQRQE